MNREDPYRQITDKTRRRIQRSYNERVGGGSVSDLPPRTELHRQRRSKPKKRLKYPVIRVLALFFILVPITFFAIYSNLPEDIPVQTEPADKGDHEKISIDDSQEFQDSKEDGSESEAEKEAETPQEVPNTEAIAENVDPTPAPPQEAVTQDPGAGTVQIPPAQSSEQPSTAQNMNKNKVIKHTVRENDTLYNISIRYYGSQAGIAIIKKANNLTSDEIQLGQVLKIPL